MVGLDQVVYDLIKISMLGPQFLNPVFRLGLIQLGPPFIYRHIFFPRIDTLHHRRTRANANAGPTDRA